MSLNSTKINWGIENLKTWNPIVGCKHGCKYCYAKRIAKRFKMIPEWTEPMFFEKRLADPCKWQKPATIFVGSMSDIFGEWIPDEWINKIIRVTIENPQHKFMFLTKNPQRYYQFEFSKNCWLGTTLDHIKYKQRVVCLDSYKRLINKFVSIEPILSDMSGVDFTGIDLLIVGADSSMGAKSPNPEWITSLKHD
ncbi:hypothetical protein LCGC14_1312310, partial [marine sediment metagenome]